MEITSALLDSLGKLSIEVTAIVAMCYVILLMSKAVSKLSDSHRLLASALEKTEFATERMGQSHESLCEMIKKTNDLTTQNIFATQALVDSLKRNKCPAATNN